jgi:hypothetical protein
MIIECVNGWPSWWQGTSASHAPIPLSEDFVDSDFVGSGFAESICCAGLLRPLLFALRRDSPKEGSSESGLGVVVLRSGADVRDTGDRPSLDKAVMHDRSRRIA